MTTIKVRDAKQMAAVLAVLAGAWTGRYPAISQSTMAVIMAMGVAS